MSRIAWLSFVVAMWAESREFSDFEETLSYAKRKSENISVERIKHLLSRG
jgi:hypothetical protein